MNSILNTGWDHCIVLLGKILNSHIASLLGTLGESWRKRGGPVMD